MPKETAATAKKARRKPTIGTGAAAETKTKSKRKDRGSKAVAETEGSTRGRARKRRPVSKRKLDLVYLIFFVIHLPVMLGELLDLIACVGEEEPEDWFVDRSSLFAALHPRWLIIQLFQTVPISAIYP